MLDWAEGVPRPDHGPGFVQRCCPTCRATWVGQRADGCWWCVRAEERLVAETRRVLLDPPWLRRADGLPRYDELDEAGKATWDRTRGQERGAHSVDSWVGRMKRAVEAEMITSDEAHRAVDRILGVGDGRRRSSPPARAGRP